jgi:signal transduction histidine kinase
VSPLDLTSRPHLAGRPWNPPRADAWLAGAMAVASIGWVMALPSSAAYRPVDLLGVVLAAVAPLALVWRSTAPLPVMAGTGLIIALNAAAGYGIGFLSWPAWIALFTCYAVGGRDLRVAATAVAIVAVGLYLAFDHGTPASHLPGIAVSFVFASVAGELSRRRTRAAAAEARRADESSRRALAAERLLAQERARLARELHDSLGHTVNVMVLQAGVGRRVFGENAGYAREALESIESAGRGALAELDQLLRVLQPDERGAPRQLLAPTLADLEELAERIRATGRPVEMRLDAVTLTSSCARAIYRIVQEALTNAVRHTSDGRIRVHLEREGDRVVVDVLNEGGRFDEPLPGRGLVNMRERAWLEGGVLEAGPVEGGFRVRAVLPVGSSVTA